MDIVKGSATPTCGVESSCDEETLPRRGPSGSTVEVDDYERARALFVSLGDAAGVAQCDEARARTLVSEGKHEEAERVASAAVNALESSDRPTLLAECLTTLAIARARAGRSEDARETFMRAVETAEEAGDRESAGRAALALAEELCEAMSPRELCEAFGRAYGLLYGTRDMDTLSRLNECARRAVEAATHTREEKRAGTESASAEERWAGFSLKAEVLRYEAELIERALNDAGGGVSYAARLLGFRHHQTFVALLNNRHKNLLHARNPVVPRRRATVSRSHRAQR
jgi:tetratricopeptide (TPR) repeat protein